MIAVKRYCSVCCSVKCYHFVLLSIQLSTSLSQLDSLSEQMTVLRSVTEKQVCICVNVYTLCASCVCTCMCICVHVVHTIYVQTFEGTKFHCFHS